MVKSEVRASFEYVTWVACFSCNIWKTAVIMRHANTHMYPLNKAKHVAVVHRAMMMVRRTGAWCSNVPLQYAHIMCINAREERPHLIWTIRYDHPTASNHNIYPKGKRYVSYLVWRTYIVIICIFSIYHLLYDGSNSISRQVRCIQLRFSLYVKMNIAGNRVRFNRNAWNAYIML